MMTTPTPTRASVVASLKTAPDWTRSDDEVLLILAQGLRARPALRQRIQAYAAEIAAVLDAPAPAPQVTIAALFASLARARRRHGGNVPLWMAYPSFGPVLPSWATETALRPIVDVRMDESIPGHPAVLLLGLGAALGEPLLTLDLDPEALAQGGIAHE